MPRHLSIFPTLLLIGSLLAVAAPKVLAEGHELPEGAGKVPLQRICSACHAAEIVADKHETKERWDQIVSSMVEKGATGTDEELNLIVEYLAANFSKAKPDSSSGAKPEAKPR